MGTGQLGNRGRTVADNLRGIRKPRVIGSTPIAGSMREPNVEGPLLLGPFSMSAYQLVDYGIGINFDE